MSARRLIPSAVMMLGLGGCGLGVPQLTEVYDRGDPSAALNMQLQIKRAIYCELREAAEFARHTDELKKKSNGQLVTTVEDIALPPTWGAQIEVSFTVDEKSTLSPGVSLITPMHDAPVNFVGETIGASGILDAITYGPKKVAQSYTFGLGGTLSSQAFRVDKYDYYYSMKQLIDDDTGHSTCVDPQQPFGPDSHSSPFLVTSNLGIKEWLPDAVIVNSVLRSSRPTKTGVGAPPLGGDKSDSFSYNIRFVIVSSGNVTPTWNLVRVSTSSNPLFDANRTRTHELLITIGPGKTQDFTPIVVGRRLPRGILARGPSDEAAQSHLASQIGNAVARSLRAQ
jgi:hypothetical protein